MKKIGLIDADLMDNGTRHPNLALMKIAGYYKGLGCNVELIYRSYDEIKEYDLVFLSKVFTFTEVPSWVLDEENVKIGGTGFFEDGGENLPPEIEHHMPYYDLYKDFVETQIASGRSRNHYSDYLDYSIGFTTRGCFRKCSFCVNKKYNKVHQHSPIKEFFNESRPYIYLWDDNILAYPQWEDVLDSIEEIGKPFQFRQGLDLRLMTDKKAKRFNNTHYQGDFIFAFDSLEDKDLICEKVQLWKRYSSKVCKMYVLSGYDSQDEKDIRSVFERIRLLMKYGCLPYIMRYESYKDSKYRGMYVELARWCNQPQFYKKKSFREFCIANQQYKKNQDTNCSSYQAMLDFERDFPEIAKEYFDLKFEDENIYKVQYGYGRKYQNKPLCKDCKKKGLCWDDIYNNKENTEVEKIFIQKYFSKEIDLLCLKYENAECSVSSVNMAKYIIDVLLKYSINEIIDILKETEELEEVTPENIPQFSDINDSYYRVLKVLIETNESDMNFSDMGYYLRIDENANRSKDGALKKYGENHSKLAALMDLVLINKSGHSSYINPSELGRVFYNLDDNEKENIICKQMLRIPIIRNAVFSKDQSLSIDKDIEVLSKTTQKRRRSNVITMLKLINEGRMKY